MGGSRLIVGCLSVAFVDGHVPALVGVHWVEVIGGGEVVDGLYVIGHGAGGTCGGAMQWSPSYGVRPRTPLALPSLAFQSLKTCHGSAVARAGQSIRLVVVCDYWGFLVVMVAFFGTARRRCIAAAGVLAVVPGLRGLSVLIRQAVES